MTDAATLYIGGARPLTSHAITLDLDKLIVTKLLVQANSGGGKSYAIRYLLEQTYGKVQHIVIDREGEFSTLRAIHPYLLVGGTGGDVAADTNTAKLLARKVLELGLSTIVDLSEMSPGQQRAYVRVFIDSINHAPRALWKDCIIVIDEAHIFAPEKGKGESEARESIALLLSTGRKRGFCAVLATQRLAKLDKDVAAECLNKLIGRTSNEDLKRAAEELGQGKQSSIQLRGLDPGTFWAYGTAISPEPVLVRTGKVRTSPPARGAEKAKPPAAPEEIRAALAKELAELPKQAADEAQSVGNLQRQVAELTRELTRARREAPPPQRVEVPVIDQAAINTAVTEERRGSERVRSNLIALCREIRDKADAAIEFAEARKPAPLPEVPPRPRVPGGLYPPKEPATMRPTKWERVEWEPAAEPRASDPNGEVPSGALKMLRILAQHQPDPVDRARLARLAGFAVRGRTFREYKRQLKQKGYIVEDGESVNITEPGYAKVGAQTPMVQGEAWRMWHDNMNAGQRRIMEWLRERHPQGAHISELRHAMSMADRTFREYLRVLKQNSLVELKGQNVRLADELAE